MNDGAYFGASSAATVRPRATTDGNSPTAQSKKAERIDMSTRRFRTSYGVDAAMMGSRGHEKSEQHGDLQGRHMAVPQESGKKAIMPATPAHNTVGA